jgi:ribosomal protein S18 acetylase RimI-like enzyme
LEESSGRGVFGVYVDGELSGFVALGREKSRKFSHKAQIWGMYVAPALRGKGLGRALLSHAIEFARSIPGVCRINLIVNAQNEQAVNLYRSAGFEVFGREPDAMCVDGIMCEALHMGLTINGLALPKT